MKRHEKPKEPKPRAAKDVALKPWPQSWMLKEWNRVAPEVPPHSRAAAKHMIRHHLHELERFGALTRQGRELVIWGNEYARWMRRPSARRAVLDY